MGGIKKAVGGIVGDGGKGAASAARGASEAEVKAKREALKYLKEADKIPRQFREGSLRGLGGLLGLEGGDAGYQQRLLDLTQQSPIYGAQQEIINQRLMDAQDALGRNASMSGMLRSGALQESLAKEQVRAGASEQQALANLYNQNVNRLEGLTNLRTNENAIANLMGNIGKTQGEGMIGAANAREAGRQSRMSNITGLVGMGASLFSDPRLKTNIEYLENYCGHRWYKWDWNEEAEKLGLKGSSEGVMAHEVAKSHPDSIGELNGYLTVNYSKLGIH